MIRYFAGLNTYLDMVLTGTVGSPSYHSHMTSPSGIWVVSSPSDDVARRLRT